MSRNDAERLVNDAMFEGAEGAPTGQPSVFVIMSAFH